MQLLIRRLGSLIDISPDGRSPLPEEITRMLAPQLTYKHTQTLHGHAAYDSVTGGKTSVIIEDRRMFALEQGRLTTGYGFIPRVSQLLQQAGHEVHFCDLSPPRQRPRCYETDWATVRRHIQFRPRQEELLQVIERSPGGIIDATMGFGKTFVIVALCLMYPFAKIAIVIKSADVARRLVRQLTKYVANVGMVGDNERTVSRVTVYTAGSVHHCDGDVDLLLADEGHQLMSKDISRKLGSIFRYTRNFTFTASPEGRLDGAHAMLECLFGPKIFYLPYPEAVQLGLVVPIRVRWLPVMMGYNPAHNRSGIARWRWGIWRNDVRNQIIANDVRTNYGGSDAQVLISVFSVEHAIHLWHYLPEFELCYDSVELDRFESYQKNGLLPQSFQRMTPDRRERLRTGFENGQVRKVIATDVWSTGVDFESLPVLYRADGRDSEILDSQWPGRTSRIFDGKEFSEIVDCIDYFDTNLHRRSVNRRRHYRKHEWADDWPVGGRQISRG